MTTGSDAGGGRRGEAAACLATRSASDHSSNETAESLLQCLLNIFVHYRYVSFIYFAGAVVDAVSACHKPWSHVVYVPLIAVCCLLLKDIVHTCLLSFAIYESVFSSFLVIKSGMF